MEEAWINASTSGYDQETVGTTRSVAANRPGAVVVAITPTPTAPQSLATLSGIGRVRVTSDVVMAFRVEVAGNSAPSEHLTQCDSPLEAGQMASGTSLSYLEVLAESGHLPKKSV